MRSLTSAFLGAGIVVSLLYWQVALAMLLSGILIFTILSGIPQAYNDDCETQKDASAANTDVQIKENI